MTISAGSITINGTTGAHTGSGASFEALDAWWTAVDGDAAYPDASMRAAVKNGLKPLIQAIADAVLHQVTSHGEVTVTITTSSAGLQRDPVSPYTATLAPASNKTLSGTIA
jgi:hypothetical protein